MVSVTLVSLTLAKVCVAPVWPFREVMEPEVITAETLRRLVVGSTTSRVMVALLSSVMAVSDGTLFASCAAFARYLVVSVFQLRL